MSVILEGDKVPLYGAGAGLTLPSTGGGTVKLTLNFDIITRGYVVGKLVRVKHHKHVSCPITVDISKTKPIKLSQHSCTYEWMKLQFKLFKCYVFFFFPPSRWRCSSCICILFVRDLFVHISNKSICSVDVCNCCRDCLTFNFCYKISELFSKLQKIYIGGWKTKDLLLI